VADAVGSCLAQTYRNREIIVVDDGSTDASLAKLSQFGGQIVLLQSSHKGGNAARNLGFANSHGRYIQFLDADDLLLPEKLQEQVRFLQAEGGDVVLGSWSYLIEENPGSYRSIPGASVLFEGDPICHLTDRNWAPSCAYLYRRETIKAAGGWDEPLTSMQDVDFIARVAMSGRRIVPLPRQCCFYRRPLALTVSTRDKPSFARNNLLVIERIRTHFDCTGLTAERREFLVRNYAQLVRGFTAFDRKTADYCLQHLYSLEPGYLPTENLRLRLVSRLLGYGTAARLSFRYQALRQTWSKLGRGPNSP